jgi:hypothetical protein
VFRTGGAAVFTSVSAIAFSATIAFSTTLAFTQRPRQEEVQRL